MEEIERIVRLEVALKSLISSIPHELVNHEELDMYDRLLLQSSISFSEKVLKEKRRET